MIRTIKYKLHTAGCAPVVNDNGNAFDLKAGEYRMFDAPRQKEDGTIEFSHGIIPLGISMELPAGCKADVKPRSSTFKKWWIIEYNSPGLIDHSFCGDTDQWGMPVIAFNKTRIKPGDRICQFEIRPTQTATLWQKFLWAITTGYRFVEVDTLGNKARGGFGEGTKHVDGK